MASVAQDSRPFPWRAWVGVAAAVVVLGAGGYYAYSRHAAAVAAAAAPPRYITATAGMGPVATTVTGSGSIAPVATQTVDPQVSGTVGQVDVTVGQDVKAGQALFQMVDTSGLAEQVTSAEAALAQAQQQLASDQNPSASVDPRTVQSDQLRVQQAQANLTQAEANLSEAQSTAAADAQVTSPVAGTVQAVNVVAGQQVTANSAIAVIQPSGTPTITVGVPEQDLPYLPVGSAAVVSVPAVQATVPGTVTAVADTSSGQVEVNGSGEVVSGGAGTSPQALYDLTVTPSQPLSGVPSGATATVTFTPQGHPPAIWSWAAAGTVAFPATVDATAQQAGTVSDLPAVGATVGAGQQIATVTPAAGSANTVQQDQYQVQQDQIALQEAQITLSEAQSPTPPSAETVAAAEATVSSDEQTLAQRQQALSELTVTAPIAGVVTAVDVQPAEVVGPSTTGVTIESSDQFQAQVSIAEDSIGQVATGDAAAVTVSALPGQTFAGTVATISPVASGGSGVSAYTVSIDVAKPQGLLAGMSATANITTEQVASTLRVPTAAVKTGASGQKTVSLMESGKPVAVPVQTGLTSTQWTQITSGVEPGQTIVLGVLPHGATRSAARGGAAGAAGVGVVTIGGGFAGGGGGFGGGGGGFPGGG